ncbi:MAG: ATP-binding cassette domain-containing protein [Bacteroidales bacterium]|nr:ATP-binding cassette domain-containing protein [Bacteroidales bacterium]
MDTTILSTNKLSKKYGRLTAVSELDLEVRRGNVYGILGPNGSGKTTTLGMILQVINPSGGEYRWFGQMPNKETRKRIGAILENPLFYPYLNATKNLELIARMKDVDNPPLDELLDKVGLLNRKHSAFKTFSFGMKQRLALASALLGNPEVLILDEPTNGLDPQGIAEIRELIRKIANEGVTIILASHLLDEVQKTCSHVAILRNGKKLHSGKVNQILADSTIIELQAEDMEKLENLINETEQLAYFGQESGKALVKLKQQMKPDEINRLFYNKGIVLSHLATQQKSLEKHFLELLADNNE